MWLRRCILSLGRVVLLVCILRSCNNKTCEVLVETANVRSAHSNQQKHRFYRRKSWKIKFFLSVCKFPMSWCRFLYMYSLFMSMSQSLGFSALLQEMSVSGNWLGTTCVTRLLSHKRLCSPKWVICSKKKKKNHKMAINLGYQMINRCCPRGAFHARECSSTDGYDNKLLRKLTTLCTAGSEW